MNAARLARHTGIAIFLRVIGILVQYAGQPT